jgi:hypothetical protein
VPDQVTFCTLSEVALATGGDPEDSDPQGNLVVQHIQSTWLEQRRLLARTGALAGIGAAARQVLDRPLVRRG